MKAQPTERHVRKERAAAGLDSYGNRVPEPLTSSRNVLEALEAVAG